MIFEAIQHILTPAPKEVKALGYVHEAIAIEARFTRCRAAWADHLNKCKQQIIAAAKRLAPGSTIMIIGSGGLHDVPLTELLVRGYDLNLVDIVHLPKIRRLYGNNRQIRLIEQDVTGRVSSLYQNGTDFKKMSPLPRADLVISLNILSQLPLNLVTYAQKHHISLSGSFSQTIMTDHLTLLLSLAPEVLIISDVERSYKRGGELVGKETVLPECDLENPIDTWDWHIAPKGELDKAISVIHHVTCWHMQP